VAASCRGNDLIARIADDRFAILFDDVDHATATRISQRLVDTLAAPLPPEASASTLMPPTITATVALAHQLNLTDASELVHSVSEALAAGKRSAPGQLVLAS
jgi:GGDEF domain-containing protein